jgi:hypothetical protein
MLLSFLDVNEMENEKGNGTEPELPPDPVRFYFGALPPSALINRSLIECLGTAA